MTNAHPTLVWTAPDGGFWEWQGSHVPGVPTPIYRELHRATMPTAIGRMFARYGVPLKTLDEAFVNGRMYATLRPLLGRPGAAAPPKPVLWAASRLHPELRRRNKAAARALEDRVWRARTVEWKATVRPALRRKNLALQAEDVGALGDAALADHVDRAHTNAVEGHLLHFDLHGDDMGPLGLFLGGCRGWGIIPAEAIAALTGHSPSTTAAVDALRKVAVAVGAAEVDHAAPPATLDDLRRLGPAVSSALDEYLEEYGWRVVTGYDLDAATVGELPDVLVANLLSLPADGAAASAAAGDAAAAALRARVPVAERARFDDVLGEARTALDLRDDNGPMTVQWPVGLLRRALLEVGRRAVASGGLAEPEHAVELTLAEVRAFLTGATALDPTGIADRAAARADLASAVPPPTLGREAPPPDLAALPKALAAITDMAVTAVQLLERAAPDPADGDAGLGAGLGVGTERYTGRARVARSPEDALSLLEPGDVLVAPFTTPAYNAVLAMAGGLVTEEGGALSHAAVLARELGLPSVIGVADALGWIADGAQVEVDPVAGRVRVVSPSRT